MEDKSVFLPFFILIIGFAGIYYVLKRRLKGEPILEGTEENPGNGGVFDWINPTIPTVIPRTDTKWGIIGVYDTEQSRIALNDAIAVLNFFVRRENLPGGYEKIKSAAQMQNADYPIAVQREIFPEIESGAFPKIYLVKPMGNDVVETFAYAVGNMDGQKLEILKQGILRFFGR